ncbi:MAG: AAA family ATPase [Bdellovibrionaceae bacterium]|nr:AAA family ATPase [Pseudobdellovibrionaceae bacterium]
MDAANQLLQASWAPLGGAQGSWPRGYQQYFRHVRLRPLHSASGEKFFDLYGGRTPWPESFEKTFGHLKTKSIREMSSGEFQSLLLISHLCSDKKVYLFDEPFSHLNPVWIKVFTDYIAKASAEAVFIIICHHIEDFEGVQLKRLTVLNGSLEQTWKS